MKTSRLLTSQYHSLALAILIVAGGQLAASERWEYQGGPLPEPPAQTKPWQAPDPESIEGSPEGFREIVEAVDSLFQAGWADPRGCEYREIVIPYEWKTPELRRSEDFPTRGWVLPETKGQTQRYAVAWDGLVYPVISLGAKADVTKEMDLAPAETENRTYPEKAKAAPDEISLLKVPLLLRLGMIDEAAEMWKRWEAGRKTLSYSQGAESGYLLPLSLEWLQAQLTRSVQAHSVGQDDLALSYLQALEKTQKQVETMVREKGIDSVGRNPRTGETEDGFAFAFLRQVPALLEDTERRIAERPGRIPEVVSPDTVPDRDRRIALLIRDLEMVDARQMMRPGYVLFPNDPQVAALVGEGEAAIEPLLDALATDTRLTRSTDGTYQVKWGPPYRLRAVGVEEPILAALLGILRSRDQFPNLDVDYVNHGPMPPLLKPKELAEVIRAYWEKYREKSFPERWYGLLEDDKTSPAAWAEAASNLTLTESQPVPVYGEFQFTSPHSPAMSDPMRGEVLRDKVDPSISELMVKRLKLTLDRAKTGDIDRFNRPTETLAKSLIAWDGKNQIEALRWYGGQLKRNISERKEDWEYGQIQELIRTFIGRINSGDEEATRDFVQWLKNADPKRLSQDPYLPHFAPLWLFPDDPAIKELNRWLFTDPASPWVAGGEGMNPTWIAKAAAMPLVAVPEFRSFLLKQLKNPLVAALAELTPEGRTAYLRQYQTNQDSGGAESMTEPKQDIRLGDLIAASLSQVRGVPEFSTKWPLEKREAVISVIAEFVRKYGDRWAPKEEFSGPNLPTEAELRFPPLDAPASEEQVTQGLAIFTTEGASDRRKWQMHKRADDPYTQQDLSGTSAQWITLKEYPEGGSLTDGTQMFDRNVKIWQAEEALIDGTWKRMYGVVSKHGVSMVPAEEIEFGSYSLESNGWDLSSKLQDSNPNLSQLALREPGQAIMLDICTTNNRGVPRIFTGPKANGQIVRAKALGLEIKMKYYPGIAPRPRLFQRDVKWQELTPRSDATAEVKTSPRMVETNESVTILTVDLTSAFDMTKPGTYRPEIIRTKDNPYGTAYDIWAPTFVVKSQLPAPTADPK